MKRENLQSKNYEELVQLQQNGDITLIEFIESQPDLRDKWQDWIDTNPINEQSAKAFLTCYESQVTN